MRCSHWCIRHYWLWDLAQTGSISSRISTLLQQSSKVRLDVQKQGSLSLSSQNHMLHVSLKEREIGLSSVNAMDPLCLQRPAFDPVSEINSWKLALQKPDAGPQWRCADLTRLQRLENITLSLSYSTAKRKYFILAYLKPWPTLNTHWPTWVQSPSDGGHMSRVAGQEKWHCRHRSGLGCSLLTPTRMFIWSDRSVWVNDSCCSSTNDTLNESQQGTYRTGQAERQSSTSSVLPVSVNTN